MSHCPRDVRARQPPILSINTFHHLLSVAVARIIGTVIPVVLYVIIVEFVLIIAGLTNRMALYRFLWFTKRVPRRARRILRQLQ